MVFFAFIIHDGCITNLLSIYGQAIEKDRKKPTILAAIGGREEK
jgi:hypothetical protein